MEPFEEVNIMIFTFSLFIHLCERNQQLKPLVPGSLSEDPLQSGDCS